MGSTSEAIQRVIGDAMPWRGTLTRVDAQAYVDERDNPDQESQRRELVEKLDEPDGRRWWVDPYSGECFAFRPDDE